MTYRLKEITIRTNNSVEGMDRIKEVWDDITTGKLPVLFDNQRNFHSGISPVSRYSNYESDEKGDYDFSILGVTAEFFSEMEAKVKKNEYKKYDISDDNGDIGVCTKKAWQNVWQDQRKGKINRTFTIDYESSVPAEYTKDGKAHCYLYIAVK